MRKNDCFVYLIAVESGSENGPVKVGVSKNVRARISELQTASPYKLKLVHQFAFPDREIAMYMEQCFHELQCADRTNGEWFAINPIIALQILCLYVEGLTKIHLGHQGEDYVETCCRLAGVDDAKEKLAEWLAPRQLNS